jgi:uncharacterized protein
MITRRFAIPLAIASLSVFTPLPASAQVPPSAQEVARFSALHAAAHRGNVTAIEAAAAAKADLNARDSYGRTPLQVAVFAKQREAVKALVKAGANINLLENDRYDGITIASVADDEGTLRVLIQLGANAKLTTSRYDGTALIAGAPLDHVNNLHWTAVIEAIVLGDGGKRHQATLEALIKAGANLQLTDRQGNTPLALARQRGYAPMVRMLEAAGAK